MTIAPQHPDAPERDRTTPWRVDGRRRAVTRRHRHPHQHPHLPISEPPTSPADRPVVADGIELLGNYDASGYREPHYLARRGNGSVLQLTHLLHLVAAACDGKRDAAEIAAVVSADFGRTVTADNVEFLVEEKLRPLGVLRGRDGSQPDVEPPDPLLGLKCRITLLPPRGVRILGRLFSPLFWPPFVVGTVAALLAFDGWLFGVHGMAQGVRQLISEPMLFVVVFGIVVVSAAFHEIGHASACVYSGGRPGRMGAGLYLAWPAFYTDVTDAYRLPRRGRLRTDLGGIYFNALSLLALVVVYFVTHFEPLLVIAFLLQIEVLHQLLPFLRLDGYYVVSDLVGVPDLFRRVAPILRSSLPWRPTEPSVAELKPRVRFAVTTWVAVVVPVLLLNLVLIVASTPRILGTAWDSGARLVGQFEHAGVAMKSIAMLELVFLVVPILGLVITFARVGGRSGQAAWRWSDGSPARRVAVFGVGLSVLAALAMAWWPSRDYTPYRPGEKGTLQQQVRDVTTSVGKGTPLLRSPEQAQHPLPRGENPVQSTTAGTGARPTPADAPAVATSGTPAPSSSATESASASAPPSDSATPSASATPTEATSSPSPTDSPSPTSTP